MGWDALLRLPVWRVALLNWVLCCLTDSGSEVACSFVITLKLAVEYVCKQSNNLAVGCRRLGVPRSSHALQLLLQMP